MLLLDLINQVQVSQGLTPKTQTQSAQGSAVDMSNCEISTGMIVSVGDGITTANLTSATVQLEECATTNGTFVAIPNMVVTVTATTTAANLYQVARGLRTQRYVRANAITVSGTTASYPLSVVIISQRKYESQTGGSDLYPSS